MSNNTADNILDFIRNLLPSKTYSYDFRPSGQAVQAATPTSAPAATAQPTSAPTDIAQDLVRQNVSKLYGKDNPALSYLPQLLDAGKQLPQGVDPYLPLIIALRETQGGRYNVGQNNIFNMRNETGAFQDYPDINTAINGNLAQGGQSGGFTGLVGGSKPSSQSIYQDFRQDPSNMQKFFAHYSPTADKNGALDEQVQNYQWIRSHVLGL